MRACVLSWHIVVGGPRNEQQPKPKQRLIGLLKLRILVRQRETVVRVNARPCFSTATSLLLFVVM